MTELTQYRCHPVPGITLHSLCVTQVRPDVRTPFVSEMKSGLTAVGAPVDMSMRLMLIWIKPENCWLTYKDAVMKAPGGLMNCSQAGLPIWVRVVELL